MAYFMKIVVLRGLWDTDFVKIMVDNRKRLTLIHTFNMHNSLNKPSKSKISAITVPLVELPTKIIALDFKENSDTTLVMMYSQQPHHTK